MKNRFIKIFILFFSLFSFLVISFFIALTIYFNNYSNSKINISSDTIIEINYGSSLKKVVDILYKNNLIDNQEKFYWYLRLARPDSKNIQAGYYIFSNNISYAQLVSSLLNGRSEVFKITFKEGQTLKDLTKTLSDANLALKEDIEAFLVSDKLFSIINPPIKLIEMAKKDNIGGIEGYLLPETYFFSKNDSLEKIILTMHKSLIAKLDPKILAEMSRQNMSLHNLLTLASIVEKETADPKERPLIANVYLTRLKKGMRLQADPTVIYGIKNYTGKITKKDLLTPHVYNTYTNKGLPLGPISSVSIEAIKAVLWPSESDYLFFVSKNDGTHIFCSDLKCHNKAVKEWQIDFFKKNR